MIHLLFAAVVFTVASLAQAGTFKCEPLEPSAAWGSAEDLTISYPATPGGRDLALESASRPLACRALDALPDGAERAFEPGCSGAAHGLAMRMERDPRRRYSFFLSIALPQAEGSVRFGCAKFPESRMLRVLPSDPARPNGFLGVPPMGPLPLAPDARTLFDGLDDFGR